LIETSKLHPDEADIRGMCASSLDWTYILDQAYRHNTLPLLHHHVQNVDSVAGHVKLLLASHYQLKQIIGEKKMDEFVAVLRAFHERGIRAIVLKGVYLAASVYRHAALRPFGDMDILVRKEDADSVFRVLKAMDYTQSEFDRDTGEQKPLGQERLEGYEHELQHYGEFRKRSASKPVVSFSIDVHHRLNTIFDDFSYPIEEVVARATRDTIGDVPVYRLSNEDFLTHLCSHLYWHTQSLRDILDGKDAQLLAYSDIRSFIQTHDIDWTLLFDRAAATKLDKALYYTLHHGQQIYGDIVPDALYETWNQDYLSDISRSIHDRWITRNSKIKIGKWNQDFIARLFNPERSSFALSSFYEDYLEPILHRGAVLKVVEMGDPDRM